MSPSVAYLNYWKRKQVVGGGLPRFPVRRWWPGEGASECDLICFEAIRGASSLLDVGAGDLRLREKYRGLGYRGEYLTLDIGDEYAYDYSDLSEVGRTFGAILCMDVIEHLPLEEGLSMIVRMAELLDDGGVLVIQTPNARCIRHPLSWDMTHLHCYNIADVWSFLTCLGLEVEGYRIVFSTERVGLLARVKQLAAAYVTTRLLGCDYADNLLLVARKRSRPPCAP
jgi:hypothetical protein